MQRTPDAALNFTTAQLRALVVAANRGLLSLEADASRIYTDACVSEPETASVAADSLRAQAQTAREGFAMLRAELTRRAAGGAA